MSESKSYVDSGRYTARDAMLEALESVVGLDYDRCRVFIKVGEQEPLGATLTSRSPCIIAKGATMTKLQWWLEDALPMEIVDNACPLPDDLPENATFKDIAIYSVRNLIQTKLIPVAENPETENFLWDCVRKANELLSKKVEAI